MEVTFPAVQERNKKELLHWQPGKNNGLMSQEPFKEQWEMRKILVAMVLAFLVTASITATEITDVLASVQRFVDSFNKGDAKAAAAACAEQTSIIDEFPPHEWHGSGACARWMEEYDADAKKNGITDGIVTLGAPVHVDITADHAYVVVPANYAFKQNGKPMKETGSTITLAMQKGSSGWLITGWAWAKH